MHSVCVVRVLCMMSDRRIRRFKTAEETLRVALLPCFSDSSRPQIFDGAKASVLESSRVRGENGATLPTYDNWKKSQMVSAGVGVRAAHFGEAAAGLLLQEGETLNGFQIIPLGAACHSGRSCFIIENTVMDTSTWESRCYRVMLDCGVDPNPRSSLDAFPSPDVIAERCPDVIVVTHNHADHSEFLPHLVNHMNLGPVPILATPPTLDSIRTIAKLTPSADAPIDPETFPHALKQVGVYNWNQLTRFEHELPLDCFPAHATLEQVFVHELKARMQYYCKQRCTRIPTLHKAQQCNRLQDICMLYGLPMPITSNACNLTIDEYYMGLRMIRRLGAPSNASCHSGPASHSVSDVHGFLQRLEKALERAEFDSRCTPYYMQTPLATKLHACMNTLDTNPSTARSYKTETNSQAECEWNASEGHRGAVDSPVVSDAFSDVQSECSSHAQETVVMEKQQSRKHTVPSFSREEWTRVTERIQTLELRTPWIRGAVEITFYPAGHMLGAVMVLVKIGSARVLYTGDFLLRGMTHLAPVVPRALGPIDALLCESTCGVTTFCADARVRREMIDVALQRILSSPSHTVIVPARPFALVDIAVIIELLWRTLPPEASRNAPVCLVGERPRLYLQTLEAHALLWGSNAVRSLVCKNALGKPFINWKHVSFVDEAQALHHPVARVLLCEHLCASRAVRFWSSPPRCTKPHVLITGAQPRAKSFLGTIASNDAASITQLGFLNPRTRPVALHIDLWEHAPFSQVQELIRVIKPRVLVLIHGIKAFMEEMKAQMEKNGTFVGPVVIPRVRELVYPWLQPLHKTTVIEKCPAGMPVAVWEAHKVRELEEKAKVETVARALGNIVGHCFEDFVGPSVATWRRKDVGSANKHVYF